MTKHEALDYLADAGEAEAQDLADAFALPYATAAMALLRLVRQNLAGRVADPDRGNDVHWHAHAAIGPASP